MAPTSGTEPLVELDTGTPTHTGRASFTVGTNQYQVVGDKVFRIDSGLTVTTIGTLTTSSGYVGISSNNVQVFFVDGSAGWVYDIPGGTFTQVTAPGFPATPIDCAFILGFFFVVEGDTDLFYQSAINDALTWNAENFAEANSTGDILVASRVLKDRLWMASTYSISIWDDQGDAGFAFRIDGTIQLNYGVLNAKSTVSAYGYLFFISRTQSGVGSAYFSKGGTPEWISTSAQDYQFSILTNPNDGEAIVFKENGHIFYQISFTEDNKTFVFDVTNYLITGSKTWHTRQMFDGTRHIASSYVYFADTPYILSYADNYLYEMSQNILTDSGIPIYRCREGIDFLAPSYNRIRVEKFEANFQSGVGINGTPNIYSPYYVQGASPHAYLSISRNGGQTFGNKKIAPLGRIGQFDRRTIWYKNGMSGAKGLIRFKIEIYDPVRTYLINCAITYTVAL